MNETTLDDEDARLTADMDAAVAALVEVARRFAELDERHRTLTDRAHAEHFVAVAAGTARGAVRDVLPVGTRLFRQNRPGGHRVVRMRLELVELAREVGGAPRV